MLSLIGLGLWDEEDISIKGLNRAKNADIIYIELYTSKWYGDIKKLEKLVNKKIEILNRSDLEEKSENIIEKAKKEDVVILVPGDPLIATTHISLLLEAKKKGIKTEVTHNASIYSAIGECGLHVYKFGATTTIPFLEKTGNKIPISTYETIKENIKKSLHTLLLLDVISEKNKYITPNEGMQVMLRVEDEKKENVFTNNTEIIVFARAGSEKPLIIYAKVKDLLNKDFGNPPYVIILPGKLHFTEKEYLEFHRLKE
jgi:diphthine synthase